MSAYPLPATTAPPVPLLGFAALSGTGKTQLLKNLIPQLKAEGIRVGLIKHAHHEAEVDHPGKDSYELRKAGASPVMLSTANRRVMITEHAEPLQLSLSEELRHFDQSQIDILLVEGFKRECIPKIELHRPTLGNPLLYPEDPSIIAVATDAPIALKIDLPQLDLNDPGAIATFILARFLTKR